MYLYPWNPVLRKNSFVSSISLFHLLCCAWLLASGLTTHTLHAQQVKIGIVSDFESTPVVDSVFEAIVYEIDRTTGSGKKVTLDRAHVAYGMKSFEGARASYQRLSSETDLLLLVGGVSIKAAVQQNAFEKPTIGIGIIDPIVQDLPFEDGRTGVANFSYVWSSQDLAEELIQFRELHDFRHLTILVDGEAALIFNPEKGAAVIDSIRQALGTEIDVKTVSSDVAGSLADLPETTDAVYLTELYNKAPDDIQEIAAILKERKLPSFSASKWHVDQGVMASLSDQTGLEQAIRKLAIMADEALRGEPLAAMPVSLQSQQELFLNIRTVREIDFAPPFSVLFTSSLVGEQNLDIKQYSLEQVMQQSLEANLDVKISYQDIELTEQDIRRARAAVLPTLDMSVTGSQINEERANALFNSPERQVSGNLQLQQLIYSEQAIASIKIAKYLKQAQEYDTEADVLSVLLSTYQSYFDVLITKTDLIIQQENLYNS